MTDLFWVMLGCAAGGMSRYFVSGFMARRIGETFPWGTLVVNVSGAFAIGMVAASASLSQGLFSDISLWRLVVIGFLGSYTTVSSFSLQTLMLLRDGEAARAAGNIGLSLGLCLPVVVLGMFAGAKLFGQS
ncbi:fluoride efflux transporter CrcB [Pseudorhodoplanes sp.]|uniref:fluoride efflux transporter CrcB n=1 Tax=Pseudorhodoplanes sp. TaxID=1934341 RepID=UPI00391D59CD